MLDCMGEKKNIKELGMTSKALANEWAVKALTKIGNTIQKIRAGLRRGVQVPFEAFWVNNKSSSLRP